VLVVLPKAVRVGPYTYQVELDGDAIHHEHQDVVWGVTENGNQRILLDSRIAADHQKCTLLHEVLHACLHAAGVSPGTELEDEAFISHVTPTLLATLKDNPALVLGLLEETT
jgi:hypothetical protein